MRDRTATSLKFFGLSVLLTAVVLAARVVMVVAKTRPADAAFPVENGKKAFERDADIWTMTSGDNDEIKITNRPRKFDTDPAWSHDGKKITFSRETDDPDVRFCCGIYIMNNDGTGTKRATRGQDHAPSWRPLSKAAG